MIRNITKGLSKVQLAKYSKFSTITVSEFQANPENQANANKYPVFQNNVLLEPELMEQSIKKVMDINTIKQRNEKLKARLADVTQALKDLDAIKTPIDNSIKSQLKRWQVYAVTYLGVQAAWTWYDFGWDIVEPISYGITFTVAIWGMIYFSLFKHDYTFSDTIRRLTWSKQFKKYEKVHFDLDHYNGLKVEFEKLTKDIEMNSKLIGNEK